MNPVFYDVAIAVVLLIFLLRGYKRGLVLTLCGFLALFVAFIGAGVLTSVLAEPVSRAVYPMVERGIQQAMDDAVASAVSGEGLAGELDLPLEEVLPLLKDNALLGFFSDAVEQAVEEGVLDATADAAQQLAQYAALQLARLVLFLVFFVAILVAWFFLSHALDLASRLPGLNALNHLGGGALGLLMGLLAVYIAIWLFRGSLVDAAALEGSVLLRFFAAHSPLELLNIL